MEKNKKSSLKKFQIIQLKLLILINQIHQKTKNLNSMNYSIQPNDISTNITINETEISTNPLIGESYITPSLSSEGMANCTASQKNQLNRLLVSYQ